ncbi:hypothetical protein GJAV_G00202050 [Gymnothorax javanicus]|nr:hypothetical protein GJAV_G00202050 [Gymnothorax javanicus]
MASNGAEDYQAQAFVLGSAAHSVSAAKRASTSSDHPKSLTRTVSYSQNPHDRAVPLNRRLKHSHHFCALGTSPHRAYVALSSVSLEASRSNDILNCNTNSNTLSPGGHVFSWTPHASVIYGSKLAGSQSCLQLAASKNSCRPSGRLDSLQLRPGPLGKRNQRAVNPAYCSLPRATSRKTSALIESIMPADQSLLWSGNKFRVRNGRRASLQNAIRATSHPGPYCQLWSSFNSSLDALRYFTGNKGAEQTVVRLGDSAGPLQYPCSDLIQEHSSKDKELLKFDSMAQAVSDVAEHPSQYHAKYDASNGPFSMAVEELIRSSSLQRNRTANGLAGPPGSDSVSTVKGGPVNTDSAKISPSPANNIPTAKLAPLCPVSGDKKPCVADHTSDTPSVTSSQCSLTLAYPPAAMHVEGGQVHSDVTVIPGDADGKGASVYSVTNQIAAINLTKDKSLHLQQCDRSYSLCLLEDHSAMGLQVPDEETVSVSLDEFEEEDLPDELEGHCSGDDNDVCEYSSINNFSSAASTGGSSNTDDPVTPAEEDGVTIRPALVPSLFPLTPPTLYFATAAERVEMLPDELRKFLKWKLSSVTPHVVKHTVIRSHFKTTKKSHDWLGCWGHHMKSPGFRALQEYQKLNHFPGSFQIGRKDRLWRNLSKMQVRFGKQEFGFFPRSFVLPQDIKLLRKAWDSTGTRQKWIIKPPASARGIGIQVIHKWSQLPNRRPLLVQKYLHKPYLIGGNKFDLRIYVYVTSYDPLRVYIFNDGLVRFASCKYSSSLKSLSNKFMHLTNYSVNKKNLDYQSNSDDKACQGHKWALKALWQYLADRGVDTALIWEKIKDIVIKTIIASDPYVNTLVKMYVRSPYSCHELFGFDIMLDENLQPWLLEVNISPSLHSNTALDASIKGQMVRDLMNLAGFVLPQREELVPLWNSSVSSSASSLSGGDREKLRQAGDMMFDEKLKRAHFLSQSQRSVNTAFYATVLDALTPRDVRVLTETEDELTRRGEFERVFPSPTSSRYLSFFEQPRYLNILLNQWEQKYCKHRSKGIALLQSLCQKGVHLGNALDSAHPWSVVSVSSQKADSCSNLSIKEAPVRSSVVVSQQPSPQLDEYDLLSPVSSPPDTGASTPTGCSSLSRSSPK